jgi:hypothetical protein
MGSSAKLVVRFFHEIAQYPFDYFPFFFLAMYLVFNHTVFLTSLVRAFSASTTHHIIFGIKLHWHGGRGNTVDTIGGAT